MCLFTTSFLPTVGGAERSADLIVRGLIGRGHQAMVLAQRTGPPPPALPYPVRSYRRPPRQHFWPELLALPILRAHRAWKFDLLLAFDGYPAGYAATWIKRRLGIPVIVSPRGGDIQEDFGAVRKVRVARCRALGYRNADRIIAISRWAAERVRTIAGDDLPPIDVVHHGIDIAAQDSLRDQSRARPTTLPLPGPFVLHLSRVNHHKQQTTAVRAVHMLREEFRSRGIHYVIAGDGRGMSEVRRLIAELGLGDIVICAGVQTGVEKAWFFDKALFFVTASLGEGFGHVIIEAMAAGLPTLASDIPTHCEVLSPHKAGMLFKTGDSADMARQMSVMFQQAPELRPAARAAARHFTLDAMIDGYEQSCLAAISGAKIPGNYPSAAAPHPS